MIVSVSSRPGHERVGRAVEARSTENNLFGGTINPNLFGGENESLDVQGLQPFVRNSRSLKPSVGWGVDHVKFDLRFLDV